MTRTHRFSCTALAPMALAVSLGWAAPASAQSAKDFAAMRAQMELMQQQMQAMSSRIATLEGQLTEATAKADAAANAANTASSTAIAANAAATSAKAAVDADTKVKWKGGPEFASADGSFTFKPRGRLQIDTGHVNGPKGISDKSLGFGNELRRAYLGVDGTLPGGFGYRAEVDLAASNVEITDLYLTYKPTKNLMLTAGSHKPFWGLEELSSDLFTSFMERSPINTAFGYERRLGLSATYTKGIVVAQAGVFTDNVNDLNNDKNDSIGFDGRLVLAPKVAGGQLHLGGSVHSRSLKDGGNSVRYRVRPFVHTTDLRFIDSGNVAATKELGYGLEAAYIRGPLHFMGETHWQKVSRPLASDPTFWGGYAEVGYYLTEGDTRGYKGGVMDRTTPANGVDKGGIGAIELNLRYDYLDLNDAGIIGGRQKGIGVSLVWTPTAYTRFIANYGHMKYSDAALSTITSDRKYSVDAMGMRAQFDF